MQQIVSVHKIEVKARFFYFFHPFLR